MSRGKKRESGRKIMFRQLVSENVMAAQLGNLTGNIILICWTCTTDFPPLLWTALCIIYRFVRILTNGP